MNNQNILVGILFAVFILCTWWHVRENRALSRQLAKKADIPSPQWVVHFAWSRTIQLLAVLGCSILITITYNQQITAVRDRLAILSETLEKNEAIKKKQEEHAKTLPVPIPAPTPAPAPTIAAPVALIPLQQQTKPALNAAPTPATPPESVDKPTAPQSLLDKALDANPPAEKEKQPQTGNTVDDVYNPEKNGSDAQSSMDDIKKRYEDILVIYMFLKKCGKVKPEDYNTITAALAQEMASVNAPGRMQYDILAAAKGSYKEIYSESPCNGKGIDALNNQYNDYIKILSTNFPPQ